MEKTQLDTTTNECLGNSFVKLDRIMYEKVIETIGCNLPWVHYRNQSKENCQTETEFESYLNATKNLQAEIRDIKKPCKENVWTVINLFEELDWEHPRTEYETTFLGQDLRIMIEEEEYLYSFNDFIGDFGGYLGLFLGGSFIGLFDWLEKMIEQIRKRISIEQIG